MEVYILGGVLVIAGVYITLLHRALSTANYRLEVAGVLLTHALAELTREEKEDDSV